jgi:ArsR family transcriptional regulator, arsenate/arsenite/antimonite-responsive transcriptional repressor
LKKLVNLAQAIFDINRLQIIKLLQGSEMCVCELAAILDLSSPRMSQHLAVLRRAKIVKERREGKWIYYSLIAKTLEEFNRSWGSFTAQSMDSMPEMKSLLKRLNTVNLNQIKQQCAATKEKKVTKESNKPKKNIMKEGATNGD